MDEQGKHLRRVLPQRLLASLMALAAAAPCLGLAADFGVSPIRLDFDRNARTAAVTVTNDDPAKTLQVQMEAYEWTQDVDGKDHFEKTEELTFLPRIMSVQPAEQRLLRAGIRVPAAEREKAYRLFIEEIPEPRQGGSAAQVAVNVRFAIPVFAKPLKEEAAGEITAAEVAQGKLRVDVKNTGNVHFIIQSIQVKAADAFSKEVSGWYLLAGSARSHSIELPVDVCQKSRALELSVKTDRQELKRTVTVEAGACRS